MNNWIRLREDNTATAFGPLASRLLLHHRAELDTIHHNWKKQAKIDRLFNQVKYVRNVYYLLDGEGHVRAAGQHATLIDHYMQPGWTVLIRESLEPVELGA